MRSSPSIHAAEMMEGAVHIGNDGKLWFVKLDKNGRHRWVRYRVNAYESKKAPRSHSKRSRTKSKAKSRSSSTSRVPSSPSSSSESSEEEDEDEEYKEEEEEEEEEEDQEDEEEKEEEYQEEEEEKEEEEEEEEKEKEKKKRTSKKKKTSARQSKGKPRMRTRSTPLSRENTAEAEPKPKRETIVRVQLAVRAEELDRRRAVKDFSVNVSFATKALAKEYEDDRYLTTEAFQNGLEQVLREIHGHKYRVLDDQIEKLTNLRKGAPIMMHVEENGHVLVDAFPSESDEKTKKALKRYEEKQKERAIKEKQQYKNAFKVRVLADFYKDPRSPVETFPVDVGFASEEQEETYRLDRYRHANLVRAISKFIRAKHGANWTASKTHRLSKDEVATELTTADLLVDEDDHVRPVIPIPQDRGLTKRKTKEEIEKREYEKSLFKVKLEFDVKEKGSSNTGSFYAEVGFGSKQLALEYEALGYREKTLNKAMQAITNEWRDENWEVVKDSIFKKRDLPKRHPVSLVIEEFGVVIPMDDRTARALARQQEVDTLRKTGKEPTFKVTLFVTVEDQGKYAVVWIAVEFATKAMAKEYEQMHYQDDAFISALEEIIRKVHGGHWLVIETKIKKLADLRFDKPVSLHVDTNGGIEFDPAPPEMSMRSKSKYEIEI